MLRLSLWQVEQTLWELNPTNVAQNYTIVLLWSKLKLYNIKEFQTDLVFFKMIYKFIGLHPELLQTFYDIKVDVPKGCP